MIRAMLSRMRGALVSVCLSVISLTLPVEYVLIAQRPDSTGAVHAPYTADFAACCSAFSASTVSVYHQTVPASSIQVAAILAATTERDAVRLRVTNLATSESEVFDLPVPSPIGQPRPVAVWLDAAAWNARTAEHLYALETRGSPVIYGAKLRVMYQVGGQ